MKNTVFKAVVVLFISISFMSCDDDDIFVLPETYPMQELSLYPEGIVYHEGTEKTYVGSYFKGKIITVDLFGNISDFIVDESLVAVVGMAIDEKNNRLLVCNSDAGISLRSGPSTTGQLAEVIAYNLTTGAKMKTIDLSGLYQGGQFLNDLVLDNNGNVYVTNSFSPVIYKIDENDNPSVFVSDTIFNVPPQTFGLNGIVYHQDNYLIVGKSFGGVLFKISIDAPSNIQEITLNTQVNSLDGLLLTDDALILVSNNFTGAPFDEAIYEIETTDAWSTGKVTNTYTSLGGAYPTTLTLIENELFVNYGYFPELIDPNSAPNDNFLLEKVKF
jgi:sugar lactone lactonase YvrE